MSTSSTAGAPRTAFVLTGGGSLGAVQVGMMTALHDHGVDPDVLVGTSVGAVNAAYLAGPGTTEGRLAALADLWRQMRRKDVFALDPRRWVDAALGGVPSVFSSHPLRTLLATQLGYERFDDARLELAVTATDIVTGSAMFLRNGSVVDAVTASATVPGLLPPVWWDGHTMVDGAVGNPGVLEWADGYNIDHLYLLPAGYPCAAPAPTTALGAALTSLNLLLHRQLIGQVQAYAGTARLHVAPPLCPLAVPAADFGHADALMRRARASTRRWLEQTSDATTVPSASGPADVLAFHGPHEHGPRTTPETLEAPVARTGR